MHAPCRIALLGGLRVQPRGAESISRFPTQKTGALLAYLAYHLRKPHLRDVLIALLWPDAGPKAARARLTTALSSLRRQLEPPGVPAGALLQADRQTVRLNPEAVTTDVAEFDAALARARPGPAGRRRR